MYEKLYLKALVFLYAFEESVDCHLLSSFCDDSNLDISIQVCTFHDGCYIVVKYILTPIMESTYLYEKLFNTMFASIFWFYYFQPWSASNVDLSWNRLLHHEFGIKAVDQLEIIKGGWPQTTMLVFNGQLRQSYASLAPS